MHSQSIFCYLKIDFDRLIIQAICMNFKNVFKSSFNFDRGIYYTGSLLTFVFISFNVSAQQWKDYRLLSNRDTINRIDMQGRKQGPWMERFEELRGEPGFEEEGYYVNDKKEGRWRKFNLDGDQIATEFYRWGNRDGKQQYFTRNGGLYREESWKALNPLNPYDTIIVPDLNDPDIMIEKIIKQESAEVRHGTWSYYDPSTGRLVKTEKFLYGKLEGPKMVMDNQARVEDTVKSKSAVPPKPKPKEVEAFEKSKKAKQKVKS